MNLMHADDRRNSNELIDSSKIRGNLNELIDSSKIRGNSNILNFRVVDVGDVRENGSSLLRFLRFIRDTEMCPLPVNSRGVPRGLSHLMRYRIS